MLGVSGAPSVEQHEGVSGDRLPLVFADAWDGQRFVIDRADFEGAVFHGSTSFERAEFGSASFRGATFTGPVSFRGACFHGVADFGSVTFEGTASFKEAVFKGEAIFEYPEGAEEIPERPEEATFKRWADFRDAVFEGEARFGGAQFESRTRFARAEFKRSAVFTGATFTRARTLGPLDAKDKLDLDRVVFEAPLHIMAGAELVSCEGTQFRSLSTIDLDRGNIALEEAAFAEPSTITGSGRGDARSCVVSLDRANVAHLTLADVDLRPCSFLGVHNLDGLRFEGAIDFCAVRDRQAIRDEIALRELNGPESSDPAAERVTAERIAHAYRALRKGREDSKDAPGAADFYYGEMEMRRRASRGGERALLTLYWLVSGYGLRASRSLLALAATVLLFAFAFDAWGFDPDGSFGKALLFSAESTSSLFRAPTPPEGATLTDAGHVLQMTLRLLGPLFFGLALLALRGRVKR
jgi:uncharacterized protein YjbI with pentapeptide repeats